MNVKLKKLSRRRSRAVDARLDLILASLKKLKKGELAALLVKLAKHSPDARRSLEKELEIEKPIELVVDDVQSAIANATDFDDRNINHNFEYDCQAYESARNGLKTLVKLGSLAEAKRLSLELMRQGSYQVECSDEGMMTEDIEGCLEPVIRAVKNAGDKDAQQWATQMLQADRVGFICEGSLKSLSGK